MNRDAALDTYRFLRGGMPVMILMLGAAVILERLHASCWQTSISAYYYTSVHAVFIAALCAIGAMLIVYKGSNDTEDALLNLAGILAFIVAMAPTSRPVVCGAVGLDADGQSVTANVWAVAMALIASRAVSWWMYRRTGTGARRSPLGSVATWVQRAVLTVGLATLVFAPDWFRVNAHGIAAVSMFVSIILTVFITAFVAGNQDDCRCPHRRRYQMIYQAISVIMVVTLLTTVALHLLLDGFNHAILLVEAALILEFAVYWLVQTVELWGTATREPLLAEARVGRMMQAL